MARAMLGMKMQGRLLDLLHDRKVHTTDALAKSLRCSNREVEALAAVTRQQCMKGGTPYPHNIWGVGYKMSDSPE